MRSLLFSVLLLVAFTDTAGAQDKSIWHAWHDEKKLVVVTTPDWNSVQGTLTRYERRDGAWVKVSEPIPVVVGRAGLAWDPALVRQAADRYRGPIKREGDGRSPAGVFQFKAGTFGFADDLPGSRNYMHLTATIECVDDPQFTPLRQDCGSCNGRSSGLEELREDEFDSAVSLGSDCELQHGPANPRRWLMCLSAPVERACEHYRRLHGYVT